VSVARGDFNDHSDIDVLIIADRLPPRAPDRLAGVPVVNPFEADSTGNAGG
jgi:predicted nucleotidyltransferase